MESEEKKKSRRENAKKWGVLGRIRRPVTLKKEEPHWLMKHIQWKSRSDEKKEIDGRVVLLS